MPVIANDTRKALQLILQSTGIGSLHPNTVVFNYFEKWRKHSMDSKDIYVNMVRDVFELQKACMIMRNVDFDIAQDKPKGRIDIYWLVDDGGLTLLIPTLMRQTKYYKNCSLRVLIIPTDDDSATQVIQITKLLKKVYTTH